MEQRLRAECADRFEVCEMGHGGSLAEYESLVDLPAYLIGMGWSNGIGHAQKLHAGDGRFAEIARWLATRKLLDDRALTGPIRQLN